MNTIKAMTLNVRYGSAEDGINHWRHRKQLVIDRIRAFDPDLIGLQECRDDEQAEFMKQNLAEYEFSGVRRGGAGETALEMTPVLIRRTVFDRVEKGYFWLSETPDGAGSRSWDSAFPRTVSWVMLKHQPSRRSLVFANTHLDYMPAATDAAARLLSDWISQQLQQHPVILTGDFNALKESAAYRQLTGTSLLIDAYRQVHPAGTDEGTFHGFGLPGVLLPIDWILVSREFHVLDANIDHYVDGTLYPSDHYPVTATLAL